MCQIRHLCGRLFMYLLDHLDRIYREMLLLELGIVLLKCIWLFFNILSLGISKVQEF